MSMKIFYKKAFMLITAGLLSLSLFAKEKVSFVTEKVPGDKELVIYVTANDWGPSVDKIVFNTGKEIKPEEIEVDEFEISKEKRRESNHDSRTDWQEIELEADDVYCSDGYGNRVAGSSKYLTAVFNNLPDSENCSPFAGSLIKGVNNVYGYRIENDDLDLNIYKMAGMVNPLGAKFKTSEFITDQYKMSYAFYNPPKKADKTPLIIWLHGISEGGNNPYVAMFGIKSVNLASEEIQKYFKDGASVLIPQCPTAWLETTTLDANGMRVWEPIDIAGTINKYVNPVKGILGMLTNIPVNQIVEEKPLAKTSYYTESLMALIETYLELNPYIDRNRIYIGGCSAGGYMTLNMLIEKPGFFAAAIPTCEVYVNNKITDKEIQELAKVPMWFVQAKNDGMAKPAVYVSPTFERLENAGASNVHLSMYEGVFDKTGKYLAKKDDDDDPDKVYEYNGHYSWIYVLNNDPNEDGKSIFEWLSEQKKYSR